MAIQRFSVVGTRFVKCSSKFKFVWSKRSITLFDTPIQVGQVANHSRYRIHLAADRHLDDIVMSVAMRIAALAVDCAVFLFAVGVGVEAMRSTETYRRDK